MAKPRANPSLGEAFGRRLRTLREERRWTREQLAEAVRRRGLPWTADVVMTFENGRRQSLAVEELIVLTAVFELQGAFSWFTGIVRLSDTHSIDDEGIRAVFVGDGSQGTVIEWKEGRDQEGWPHAVIRPIGTSSVIDPPTSAEVHAAGRLGIPTSAVRKLSLRRWGRRLDLERDARLGDVRSADANSITARRGRVTRELLQELATELRRER